MRREFSSGSLKRELRSGELVSTTAITFSGGHIRYFSPKRSSGLVIGIGLRRGGNAVP